MPAGRSTEGGKQAGRSLGAYRCLPERPGAEKKPADNLGSRIAGMAAKQPEELLQLNVKPWPFSPEWKSMALLSAIYMCRQPMLGL